MSHKQIAGLILDNTFQSPSHVISQWLPIPIKVLDFFNPFNRFKSLEKVPKIIEIPVLFLASEKDTVIWYRQMISLYSLCGSNEKSLRTFPEEGHSSNKLLDDYWENIKAYISNILTLHQNPSTSLVNLTLDGPNIKLPSFSQSLAQQRGSIGMLQPTGASFAEDHSITRTLLSGDTESEHDLHVWDHQFINSLVTAEELMTIQLDDEHFQFSEELGAEHKREFQPRRAQAIRDDVESIRRELRISGITAIEDVLEIIHRAMQRDSMVPWVQYDSQDMDHDLMPPLSIPYLKNVFVQNNTQQRWCEYTDERPCGLKILSIHAGGKHLTDTAAFKELLADQDGIPDIFAIA